MIDTTTVLIESCLEESSVDQIAKKQFLSALKNKILDLSAFHSAYDGLINANNLKDLFGADGKLTARGTYGRIKNCTDPILAAGLKKLWTAQFVDYLKTPEEQAAQAAQQKERERQAQELQDKIKAKEQELIKNAEPILKAAKQELINSPDYISINSIYNQFADSDLVDDIRLTASLASLNSSANYQLSLDGPNSYYGFSEKDLTTETICKYSLLLAKSVIKKSSKKYFKNLYEDYIDELDLDIADVDVLYLVDNYEDKLYYFKKEEDSASIGLVGTSSPLDLTELPDLDRVQVICIKQITQQRSSNCYYSIDYNLFYNPRASRELLTKCGVAFKETQSKGWANGVDLCSFIDPEKIAYEYRRLGLIRGEQHSYEIDSSD